MLYVKTLFFLLCLGLNNSFAIGCNLKGEWYRINEDNDTIKIVFERDKVTYLINGRTLVPSNGYENSDEVFLKHNLRKFKFEIGVLQDVELYSEKILYQYHLNFKFITCDKLLLKLLAEQKEAVFFREL